MTIRNALLFCAAVQLALTAGRAFWVSLGENPFDMSGATYVEFFMIALPQQGVNAPALGGRAAPRPVLRPAA